MLVGDHVYAFVDYLVAFSKTNVGDAARDCDVAFHYIGQDAKFVIQQRFFSAYVARTLQSAGLTIFLCFCTTQ